MAALNRDEIQYEQGREISALASRVDQLCETSDRMEGKIDQVLEGVTSHDKRLTALEAVHGRHKAILRWVVGTGTAIGMVLLGMWLK